MNSAVLRATAVALAVSIAACSVIDPYMLPPQLSIDDTQKQFQQESKNAFSLYKTYGEGRNEMRLFSLYSGLVLTGLGLAGLGVALFQAPNNALFGVGLAAAS